jgi:hypothetical protein
VLAMCTAGPALAQVQATDTPPASGNQAYITNTFQGEPSINVRTGPSTIMYPVPCGSLPYGASAPALGTSPAQEWIQIAFPGCPGGAGWIYAANVTLTGSVHVVEPPPTPTPLATSTLDPTLVAAFQVVPTQSRLPTFTPPPPLALPTFSAPARGPAGFPAGATILLILAAGGIVLAVSLVGRR